MEKKIEIRKKEKVKEDREKKLKKIQMRRKKNDEILSIEVTVR